MARFAIIILCCILAACSNAKNTPIPQDLEKMDSIKPAMEKLTSEERELATAYIMRHTIGSVFSKAFGGKDTGGVPEGMTLGKAIEEQRSYIAEKRAEETKQAELKAALNAKREAVLKPMREAVTVTLVSKGLKPEHGYSGIVTDENLVVIFGYKNNTSKDISGVKGYISVQDLFGDEISGFAISNDTTIPAGKSITWTGSRSVKYAFGDNKDRKLAELEDSKFKVLWTPKIIVFSDGTTLEVPADGNG